MSINKRLVPGLAAGVLACICHASARAGELGQCCFVGIVPEPILCEETTEEQCLNHAGFISWTAGLTCETPCDGGPQVFAGCGTLGPGPQGCVLFTADSGESYLLENVAPFLGPRVWVKGIINPQSQLCMPLVLPGIEDNTICSCFEGCGTLILGVECVLFSADAGGLYQLSNLGGFNVGDRVFVRGCEDNLCVSFCMQGNGCIEDNEIESCDDPNHGACCIPTVIPEDPLTCIITDEETCASQFGTWHGPGSTCPNACFPGHGACCFDTDVPTPTPPCSFTTADICAAQNGTFLGEGTDCQPNPCPLPGRCCFTAEFANIPLCDVNTEEECLALPTFISWTPLLTCDTPCEVTPPTGACCSDIFGNPLGCLVLTQEQCLQAGGAYLGDNTTCSPINPCTGQVGRCCFLGIVPEPILCAVTTLPQCLQNSAPISWTPGLTCDTPCENPPPQGACCIPGPVQPICIVTSQLDCLVQNGLYLGDGTICNSPFCFAPLTGACCLSDPSGGAPCIDTTEQQCLLAGGVFQGFGTTCNNVICPPAADGACCLDVDDGPLAYDSCIITSPDDCAAHDGVFQGPGSQCVQTACCLPDGFCQDADPECCLASGGVPQNVPCSAADCSAPVTGACCFIDPIGGPTLCLDLTAAECEAQGGLFGGDGTTCIDNGCPPILGACCTDVDDGPLQFDTCTVMSPFDCNLAGGVFQGPGTECALAACCLPGGFCQETDPGCCLASGGVPQNLPCDAADCTAPAVGACCLLTNVPGAPNCVVTTAEECASLNGQYQGDGTQCNSADACPVLGRCCYLGINPNEVLCDVLTLAECMNQTAPISWVAFLTCDTPCSDAPQGACCVPMSGTNNRQCLILTQLECAQAGGVYLGDNTFCTATSCPPPVTGACCLDAPIGNAICLVTTAEHCEELAGTYLGDGTQCSFTTCPPPATGACCLPNTVPFIPNCLVTTPGQCAQLGGAYQGDGTFCDATTCPILGRCCFQGINPNEVLCEVSTQVNCFAHSAPISWTPGLTCDTPCDSDPPSGACCVPVPGTNVLTCIIATAGQCAAQNGVYQGDNTVCTSTTCGPNFDGACCLDIDDGPLTYDTCLVLSADECAAQGGTFAGPNTQCVLTACCIGDYCQDTSPQCCLASGGVPHNVPCGAADVCQPGPPTGACCRNITTPNGASICSVVTEEECAALGGLYRGDGTGCPWACSNAFFAGCGTLAVGPQGCTLLQTNFGLVLAIGNTGEFGIGDYVFVAGVINPTSFLCFPAQVPAIEDNVIGPCTPGAEPSCSRPGDVNGDGEVNGLDVPEFVKAVLGDPGATANAVCASYGTGTLEGDIAAFVADLTAP